ncbi:hypothetical protein STRIP9103_06889 [Streptomyces ipomoeae 91-03]|uniref:ABC transporter domain-containing protein n=1 Tax=Streptomyces ipomoeae 91-03 TaxID=698759 RepID=L1L002_9ACTN|nr:hypothetical protein STRIP9103_06889 [Streptomyces ipomoeae 91-03]
MADAPARLPPGSSTNAAHNLHTRHRSHRTSELTVQEALELYASFCPAPADRRPLTERLGLTDRLRTRFGKLSGGQKQRLFIALALIGRPRAVVLDELTTGLDPRARRDTWQLRPSGLIAQFPAPLWGAPQPDGHGNGPPPSRRGGPCRWRGLKRCLGRPPPSRPPQPTTFSRPPSAATPPAPAP